MPFSLALQGGVVGMVRTAAELGYDKLIGFDMGGTSTDVCHYAGEFERSFETEVAGVRMRAPDDVNSHCGCRRGLAFILSRRAHASWARKRWRKSGACGLSAGWPR